MKMTPYYTFHTQGCADDAPWVLLLPGVNCGAWFWEDGIKQLCPEFKVIAFNNPGIDDAPFEGVRSVKDIAKIALKVLEEIGVKKAHVLGHSMGGYVAQELALLAPEKVERLVLASTSPGQPQTAKDMLVLAKATGKAWPEFNKDILKNPSQAMKVLFGKVYVEIRSKEYQDFIDRRGEHWPGKEISALHIAWGGLFSSYGRMRFIQPYTLVIHGEDDVLVTPEGGRTLAERIKHARFLGLPDVGHFPPIEDDDFWSRVSTFFNEEILSHPSHSHPGVWEEVSSMLDKITDWFKVH